jgi:polyhydroxyalkanoate synthesis regulator phasin
MVELMRAAALLGIGAMVKTKELLEELTDKGEKNQGPAAKWVKDFFGDLEEVTKKAEKGLKPRLDKFYQAANLPTRSDLERLEKKIQELSNRLCSEERRGR